MARQNGQVRTLMGSPHHGQERVRMELTRRDSASGWPLKATYSTYFLTPQ